jgi:hypothetical protein
MGPAGMCNFLAAGASHVRRPRGDNFQIEQFEVSMQMSMAMCFLAIAS